MRPLLEVVTLRREGERTLPNFPFPSILSSSSYSLPPCPDIIQHGGDSDSATLAVSHLPPTPRPHNSIADRVLCWVVGRIGQTTMFQKMHIA